MPKRITGRWSSRGTRGPCIQELVRTNPIICEALMFTTDRAAVETCPLNATPSSLTCARSHAKRGRVTVFEALELDSFIEGTDAFSWQTSTSSLRPHDGLSPTQDSNSTRTLHVFQTIHDFPSQLAPPQRVSWDSRSFDFWRSTSPPLLRLAAAEDVFSLPS